jgi:hypothetical protein
MDYNSFGFEDYYGYEPRRPYASIGSGRYNRFFDFYQRMARVRQDADDRSRDSIFATRERAAQMAFARQKEFAKFSDSLEDANAQRDFNLGQMGADRDLSRSQQLDQSRFGLDQKGADAAFGRSQRGADAQLGRDKQFAQFGFGLEQQGAAADLTRRKDFAQFGFGLEQQGADAALGRQKGYAGFQFDLEQKGAEAGVDRTNRMTAFNYAQQRMNMDKEFGLGQKAADAQLGRIQREKTGDATRATAALRRRR